MSNAVAGNGPSTGRRKVPMFVPQGGNISQQLAELAEGIRTDFVALGGKVDKVDEGMKALAKSSEEHTKLLKEHTDSIEKIEKRADDDRFNLGAAVVLTAAGAYYIKTRLDGIEEMVPASKK